ncbi:hypothetical protein D3C76_1277450 [compost metagenome]
MRVLQATDGPEEVTKRQQVDNAQQVAQQRRGPADRGAIVVHHPQAHPLLARRAAVVQHLEQHHVPPADHEQQDRAEPGAQFAEHCQCKEQHAQDQAAQTKIDGECQRTNHQPGRPQWQVDALRRFDLIPRIQRR